MWSLNFPGFSEWINTTLNSDLAAAILLFTVLPDSWLLSCLKWDRWGKAEILQLDRERDISNLIKLMAWTHTDTHTYTQHGVGTLIVCHCCRVALLKRLYLLQWETAAKTLTHSWGRLCVCVCFSNVFPIQAVANNKHPKIPLCSCVHLVNLVVCVCVCVCLPGELHASHSRPGSRQRHGGSAGARSSPGLPPPPHCDTEESDHGCPCSLVKLPTPALSEGGTGVCVRGWDGRSKT